MMCNKHSPSGQEGLPFVSDTRLSPGDPAPDITLTSDTGAEV